MLCIEKDMYSSNYSGKGGGVGMCAGRCWIASTVGVHAHVFWTCLQVLGVTTREGDLNDNTFLFSLNFGVIS